MMTGMPDSRAAPTPASSRPLAGATVLVTRPVGTAGSFVRAARALGAHSLLLPGMALRAPADPALARAQLGQAFDDWIFVSPVAVQRAFALARPLRLPPAARAFGVGEGTRRALARHGVAALTPAGRADSEGLLACAELAAVRGRRIALVGAPGGRGLLGPSLAARGAEVVAIHAYARVPARLDRRHFRALEKAADPLLLPVSSAYALANLVAQLPAEQLARLRGQQVLASSARLAALARGEGFVQVALAASALTRDLLAAAVAALARHRL